MLDVTIVGGGPAGLAAALTLGRVRRETLVVDSREPRNAASPAMHNFLSRDGTPPAELRAIARAELEVYPTVRVREAVVTTIRRMGEDGFEIALGGGEVVRARRVLLATGVVDELPPIDGLAALWGRAVLHCPYCHGWEVRDSPLAVLGASPGHTRLALHLTRLSGDVALLTNGEALDEPDARRLLERSGVTIREEPIVRVEGEGDDVVHIMFDGAPALARRAIFAHPSTRQRCALAEELGCEILEDGSVAVDDFGRTSVPGVFAVGDMARRTTMPYPVAAVIAAAASGTIAGGRIDQELVGEEFRLPNG